MRVASLQIWRKLDAARLASEEASKRQRWLELLLEAAALIALTLAAAGPRWVGPAPAGERLIVVIDNSRVMRTRLPEGTAWELARTAADSEIAALSAGAQVQIVPLIGSSGGWQAREAARRQLAGLAVVDRPAPPAAPILRAALAQTRRVLQIARRPLEDERLRTIAIGAPESDNAGFVAVGGSAGKLWAVVASCADRELTVETPAGPKTLRLPAGGRATLELEGVGARAELRLPAGDNLSDDDALTVVLRPRLPVRLDGSGPIGARLATLLGLLDEAERVDEGGRLTLRIGGARAPGPQLWIFPAGERVEAPSPIYVARTLPSPLLDGLDLSGVPIRRRWVPPPDPALRAIAWSADRQPLILEDGAGAVVIAFDPAGWIDDPSFAIFVRRLIRQVDPAAGQRVAAAGLPGAAVTDNRGGRSRGGPAQRGATATAAELRRDFRPLLALLAAFFLLAYAYLRGRTQPRSAAREE